MKVLFDYQAYMQKIGGISRYHTGLIKNFSADIDVIFPPLFSDNIYLSEINISHYSVFPNNRNVVKENIYKVINMGCSIWGIRNSKYDIFHPTFLNPYFIKHIKCPVVSTMHDLTHEKYPNLISKAKIVAEKRKQVIGHSNMLIAISYETKFDLMKFYDIPEEKIAVVYHGVDQNIIYCEKKPLIEKPYLLYIGARNTYKNFSNLLRAIDKIDKEVDLVCTGVAFNADEQAEIRRLGIGNRIHQIFASNKELDNLLCNALAFIYPSISEGFGLPILEAYRCGCPCIISDIMCFHEVAGRAAIYFNPESVDNIATVISNTISDEEKLKQLREEGYKRMQMFTWKKTALQTEEIYRKLL